MNSNLMNTIRERSRLRWPFQRHSAAWLPTLTPCLAIGKENVMKTKEVRYIIGLLLAMVLSGQAQTAPTIRGCCESQNVKR